MQLASPLAFPLGGPPSVPAKLPQKVEDALFGVDLVFTDQLQVGGSGDYLETSGTEALRRSVLRRLLTKPGEYKLRPEYGVGVGLYVKRAMSQANLDELKQRIVDNLSQDKRIDRVLSVDFTKGFYGAANLPGLAIYVRIQARGRQIRFEPFTFVVSR